MVGTPRGQQILIGFVNDQIPGQISLKSLDFSLSDQEIKIQGLNIQDPVGMTVVEVEQIVIGFDLSKLPDKTIHFKKIEISSPGLSLVLDEDNVLNLAACFVDSGKESEPATPETSTAVLPFNIVVENLVIDQAALAFQSQDLSFETDEIALEGSVNLARKYLRLKLLTRDWSFSLPLDEPDRDKPHRGKTFKVDSINLDLAFGVHNAVRWEIIISDKPTHVPLHITVDDRIDDLYRSCLIQCRYELVADASHCLIVVRTDLNVSNLSIKHFELRQIL